MIIKYIKKVPRIPKRIKKILAAFIFRIFGPKSLLIEGEIPADAISTLEDILDQVKRPIPNEKDLKMVEIVVLKYKEPEVEIKSAQKIIENTEWPYKLTIYDNRWGTKNMSKIWNKLIKESTCDYVLIMDTDVFVPKLSPCWLTRMMELFSNLDCYVVVPKVSKTSADEQRGSAENAPPRKLTSDFAAQCVLYKKEIFDKIGFFDEDFLFYGQDTEWSHRLIARGFNAYLRPDVSVEHLKHYSISKASKNNEFNKKIEGEYAQRLFSKKTQKPSST